MKWLLFLLPIHLLAETFYYPVDPNEMLATLEQERVLLFSYGSLLNPTSAARTLSEEAMETYQPAIALDVQRVFDRDVIPGNRWGARVRENDRGMLNVHRMSGGMVNGVMMEVTRDDLAALLLREEGYDLIPVRVIAWDERIADKPGILIAYTFSAPLDERYTNPRINPVPNYYFASKSGASLYGEEFLAMWLYTTYLADRTTPILKWEENPDINCR